MDQYYLYLMILPLETKAQKDHADGLMQDCSNSSVLAMELLQSGTEPSICELNGIYCKYFFKCFVLNYKYEKMLEDGCYFSTLQHLSA